MKRSFLVIIVLFCSSLVFSQEINEENQYSIGLKYLAGQSWASGSMNEYQGMTGENIAIVTVFSQAIGANFIYHFRYNLAVETGIFYSLPGFESERERFVMYFGDTTHLGIRQAYKTTTVDFQNLYIPLKLRYTLPLRKFSFFISGGAAVNFILNAEEQVRLEEEEGDMIAESTYEIPFHKDVYFSVNLSLGLDYRFAENLIFSFEPEYHHGIDRLFNKVEMDGMPHYQPENKLRSAGVSVGLRYVVN